MATTRSRATGGRPEVTSHAAIEEAAFALFAEHGFEGTTLDDIAQAVGVGRRTLFRYFPSKNDIPWGQFDRSLEALRETLATMPSDLPLASQVGRAVVVFNAFPADAEPSHRERMRLILETPALQAHSVLRYAAWRDVIAEHVAARCGLAVDAVLPQTVGHVALALSLTAYEQWLHRPDVALADLLVATGDALRAYVDGAAGRPQ